MDPREDGPEQHPNCHSNSEVGKRRRSQQKRWRKHSQHGRWKAAEIWCYRNQKINCFRKEVCTNAERYIKRTTGKKNDHYICLLKVMHDLP